MSLRAGREKFEPGMAEIPRRYAPLNDTIGFLIFLHLISRLRRQLPLGGEALMSAWFSFGFLLFFLKEKEQIKKAF